MADIDNELDDLYSQLSSLSSNTNTRSPRTNKSSGLEKLVKNKSIPKQITPNKVDRVKSLLSSEINSRRRGSNSNIFDNAGLKEQADKQNKLKDSLSQLDESEIEDIESKVRDNLGKKENQSGNIFKKLNSSNKTSFEIIDNSESAVTILDRDELISNKSLFVNQTKRKAGEKPADRDNSNYVNTSAKLLKDNNTFAPLQLKKYNSK